GGRSHADIIFGEVDAGLEERDEFQELFFERGDAAGNRAAGLLGGDARLVKSGSVDEVADGFRLGEIEAAVEECPQGELAGFGEAGAGVEGALDTVAQDHRGSM